MAVIDAAVKRVNRLMLHPGHRPVLIFHGILPESADSVLQNTSTPQEAGSATDFRNASASLAAFTLSAAFCRLHHLTRHSGEHKLRFFLKAVALIRCAVPLVSVAWSRQK